MLEEKKNLELKKHVGTIHSSGDLSLLQRKIANGLLFNAYDELLSKDEHRISIRDLCMLIGFESHDRKIIKTALKSLLSTVVEWNLIGVNDAGNDGVWNASSIIADASVQGPICTYSYSNRMKQLLYHPSIYGRLNMLTQSKFKSGYGLTLYENCIRYQNLNNTPWVDFILFRKLMGVSENKYPIFAEFKKRVLNVAVKEVNLHAPILIEPEIKKEQKKVVYIRFLIKKKHGVEKNIIAANIGNEAICQKLHDIFNIPCSQATSLLEKHGEQYVLSKMSLVESSPSFAAGNIKNLGKYLLNAIEHDYQSPKSSREIVAKNSAQLFVEDQEKKNIRQKQEAYDKYVRHTILDNFNALEKSERDEVIANFLVENESNIQMITMYKQRGISSGFVASQLVLFIKSKVTKLLCNIMSCDDYFIHGKNNG